MQVRRFVIVQVATLGNQDKEKDLKPPLRDQEIQALDHLGQIIKAEIIITDVDKSPF
jgi:hypothetical protein